MKPAHILHNQRTPEENNAMRFGRLNDEKIEDYHSCGAISKTRLDVFIQSPRLFYKRFISRELPPDPPTEALIMGGAIDAMFLDGPDEFVRRYALLPEDPPRRPTAKQRLQAKRTPAAEKSISFWDAWDEANKGKIAVTSDQMETVGKCVTALAEDDTMGHFKRTSTSQVTFRLRGDKFAVQVRPDLWCEEGCELTEGNPAIVDLKTIEELPADEPDHISRHMAKFAYHRSAFLYREVLSLVMGFKDNFRPKFFLAFVEKKEPFAVIFREVDDISIEIGERETQQALTRMAKCLETGKWPFDWNDPMISVGLPQYYIRRALEGYESNLWG